MGNFIRRNIRLLKSLFKIKISNNSGSKVSTMPYTLKYITSSTSKLVQKVHFWIPALPRLLLMLTLPLSFYFILFVTLLTCRTFSYYLVTLIHWVHPIDTHFYQCLWFSLLKNTWHNTHKCIVPCHEGTYPFMVKPRTFFYISCIMWVIGSFSLLCHLSWLNSTRKFTIAFYDIMFNIIWAVFEKLHPIHVDDTDVRKNHIILYTMFNRSKYNMNKLSRQYMNVQTFKIWFQNSNLFAQYPIMASVMCLSISQTPWFLRHVDHTWHHF